MLLLTFSFICSHSTSLSRTQCTSRQHTSVAQWQGELCHLNSWSEPFQLRAPGRGSWVSFIFASSDLDPQSPPPPPHKRWLDEWPVSAPTCPGPAFQVWCEPGAGEFPQNRVRRHCRRRAPVGRGAGFRYLLLNQTLVANHPWWVPSACIKTINWISSCLAVTGCPISDGNRAWWAPGTRVSLAHERLCQAQT